MSLPFLGIKVIELAGLAPVPFCGMILADFGAQVTVALNKSASMALDRRLDRGKTKLELDFKNPKDLTTLKELCLNSDVLLDPFRPGTIESFGLDPEDLLKGNSKLIIARLSGYGQTGPLAKKAGHDINYVALSGMLPTISGHGRKPLWPPANILADFAGGGLMAAFGIATALFHRSKNGGKGCVVDCSMTEGVAYLGSFISAYKDVDFLWNDKLALFSGECPIYRTYETLDERWIAVGAIEPKFTENLFKVLGLNKTIFTVFTDPKSLAMELEEIFRSKTQEEWSEIFKDKDACVTPVLELEDVGDFEQHKFRESYITINKNWASRPTPKLYTLDEYLKQKEKIKSKI